MKQANLNPIYFSENITERDLILWEENHDKAKEEYYERKETLSEDERGI
jgi:hypothetical protein